MALSKAAIISIVVSVGLLLLLGLILGILAATGTFSSGSSGTDSGSSGTDSDSSGTSSGTSGTSSRSTATPPTNGVRVTDISMDLGDNSIIYGDDSNSFSMQTILNNIATEPPGAGEGKYFYVDQDDWKNIFGDDLPNADNVMTVEQWRDNGNEYEKIWTGTVTMRGAGGKYYLSSDNYSWMPDGKLGGRLEPWQYDQDATWEDDFENDANIWMIGDYIVKP